MPLWIVPVIFSVFVILMLSFSRLKVQRDLSREGRNDLESTLAYDRVSRWLLFGLIRFFVIHRLKRYCPKGTMLDAGCGPGYLALAIARKYPLLKITGIDLSPEMIKLANTNLASSSINSRMKFQEADIQDLPFATNYVDFAVSTLSLHHWSDPRQALLEIHRVLKPRSQFLIFDLRRDMPRILFIHSVLASAFSPRALFTVSTEV